MEYDGGDRLVLLSGGCWVSLPPAAPLNGGAPFRTEFSVLLQTSEARAAKDGIQDAVVVGDDETTSGSELMHMARSQRIYLDGQLATASSAFLTAGGMPYY